MAAAEVARLATVIGQYREARTRERLLQAGWVLAALVAGGSTVVLLQIPLDRLLQMFPRIFRMVADRMLPPDLGYAFQPTIVLQVLETIEMTALGVALGLVLSVVIAWLAAWNVTPSRRVAFPLARSALVGARAVPTLIWAMILVTVLGFGPLPGVLALMILTVGFAGKLMAEQVEAIDMGPVDAIRTVGAGPMKEFVFAVLPQVRPTWLGIAIYTWDTVFRASTVLGFVGAGGLGISLRITIQELEYERAMGIICLIIVLVVASEVLSHIVRSRLYRQSV